MYSESRTYLEELDMLKDLYATYGGEVFDTIETWVVDDEKTKLYDPLKIITAAGGEGIMLRDPDSVWFPKRRPFLLKVKPRHDAEATVTGFYAGRKGKTSQFLGKLGGLICEWKGDPTAPCGVLKESVAFEIGTGLTHQDRELYDQDEPGARANPGKPLCGLVSCTPHFKIGDVVTFSYMGCTDDNAPREPAYLRKREDS
jgi:DNA ligase-1